MLKGPLQTPDLGGARGRVSFPLRVRGPGPPHHPYTGYLKHCYLSGFPCVLSTDVLSHSYVSFCFVLHAENRS